MTLEVRVNNCLTREAMATVAMRNGSNLEAQLRPRDVAFLEGIFTKYAMTRLNLRAEKRESVLSQVRVRMNAECEILRQDMTFPDNHGTGGGLFGLIGRLVSWIRL